MSELNDLLDLLDLAIGRSAELLDDGLLDEATTLRRRLRVRGSYIEDALVVAVAGGTGAGKSSLVNRLTGVDVVVAGQLRPTTQRSTAVVPAHLSGSIAPLVEAIGVDDTVEVDVAVDRVVVDLPDFDSVEAANRLIVERVLPAVDVVVWIADPEKYADPTMRREFLEDLVPYESQFVFVLNKIDRLGDASGDVVEHYRTLLSDIGFGHPVVVGAISTEAAGEAPDVAAVRAELDHRFETKRAALAKAALDIRMLANDGWAMCRGLADASGNDDDAVAASTFVSLGVAGYGLYDRSVAEPPTPVQGITR